MARAVRSSRRSGRGRASRFSLEKRRAGRDRPDRGRCRSPSATRSIPTNWSKPTAQHSRAMVHAASDLAARARRHLDRGEASRGPSRQTQRLWLRICEIERVVGPDRPPPPADWRAIKRDASAGSRMRRSPRSRMTSSGCVSIVCIATRSTNSPTSWALRWAPSTRRRSTTISATPSLRPAIFLSTALPPMMPPAATCRRMLGSARP